MRRRKLAQQLNDFDKKVDVTWNFDCWNMKKKIKAWDVPGYERFEIIDNIEIDFKNGSDVKQESVNSSDKNCWSQNYFKVSNNNIYPSFCT